MDIAKKKKEILRLVEQLHAQSVSGKRIRRLPTPDKKHPLSEPAPLTLRNSIEPRDIQPYNENDSLEERLLNIYRGLEERIQKIEQFIAQNGSAHRSLHPSRHHIGMEVAENQQVRTLSKNPQADLGSSKRVMNSLASELGKRSVNPNGSEKPDYSLGGKIQDGILPDLLQLVSSNNKTGIFSLEHKNSRIELYFDDGTLYHAKTDNMEGQNAFFAAMALEEGRFFFQESTDLPTEKTIDGNTQFMILEALRQIDEQRNSE